MLIFISMFVIFRHRAIDNANIVKQRGKKANKVATKRLKRAKKMMDNGNQTDFYDEVLRTLWGYVGDKLNMPVTQISRENISQCLAEYSVSEEIINQFMQAIDECEFERYAPGDIKGNMSKTFEAAGYRRCDEKEETTVAFDGSHIVCNDSISSAIVICCYKGECGQCICKAELCAGHKGL